MAGLVFTLSGLLPSLTQAFTPIDPMDALGVWDFNDTSQAAASADLVAGTLVQFQGNTAFSADSAGRKGVAGDRAMNFGTAGNSSATITNPAFMAILNDRNLSGDKLSVVFWQKWSTNPANSSTIWFRSSTANDRGFQAHLPWGNNTIYFDTAGCCSSPSQRLLTTTSTSWQTWNHIALVKDGGAKQIWINGQLVASQNSGASPLPGNWADVLLGYPSGSPENPMKGMIDDLAMFSTALTSEHISALASGSDPLSLVVPESERPPVINSLVPAAGATFHPTGGGLGFQVSTSTPNTLAPENIRLFLDGVDITGTLAIGGTTLNRSVASNVVLPTNHFFTVRAEATDQAGRAATRTWTFDTADPATVPNHPALVLPGMAVATASGAANPLPSLIDGDPSTCFVTPNVEGAFIEVELDRKVRASRILIVAPEGAEFAGLLDGARIRVCGMRDQVLHEASITTIAPGGTWALFLPPGIDARILRIDLPPGQTNGLGDHRLALADLKVIADPSPEIGPINLAATATATQSSTNGTNAANLALDSDGTTASQTQDVTNSHWLLTLDRARPVRRIEIIAPNNSTSARVGGLTVRLLDAGSNTLAVTSVTHPGAGATWGFDVPPGTADARFVRIGLENGASNGNGDHVVTLAGVSVFTGTNFALGTPSYMVRLTDSLPSPSLANDGNFSTYSETTTQTVDGYWETDLGQTRSLYSVRVSAFDAGDHQKRLTHATLRLFDANHESVFSRKLDGTSADFDIVLPGPVSARYVRVGLENKERTSATGGYEWFLRFREIQAYGLPSEETGVTSFAAFPASIAPGGATTLSWHEVGLRELSLYPGGESAGSHVDASGAGSLTVSPTETTEYLLVGANHDGPVTRAVTVTVDGVVLPPRISEFVASNRFSLTDGNGDEPDWIELHNPNSAPFVLTGHGLSDSQSNPFKWVFPAGTAIPANGHLIVFASGEESPVDAGGNLHAGFSLSASGESIVLTAPGGETLDIIASYPAQHEDLAYGRALNGTTGFLTPSPRGHNLGVPVMGWLSPAVFSHQRGFHDTAFSLVLTQPDPAAALFYSTDGTDPSIPYAGPITVNATVTIRAAVRRDGFQSPPVETHTYLFRDSVMGSPLMSTTYTQGALSTRLRNGLTGIPTISLTVPVVPDDYIERPASIEVFLPDGSEPRQVNAGLARFGGSWTEFAKKSYRVRFSSAFGAKRLESPLFRGFDGGMPALDSIDTLDLSAGNHDAAERGFYMSNRFVEDTMLEMGSLNPHGRYVHVYLNGVYWGQYNAHERMDDDFLSGYLGGGDDDYLVVRGNDNDGSNFVNGTPDPEYRASWETVRTNRNSYAAVKERLDVPHLIDFMLLWFYGNCESEFRCAGPVDPGTGFKFWMADADGFLQTSALTLNTTGSSGPGGLFGALAAEGHPDFKILLADRIHRHFFNTGALTPDRNLARLNSRMTEIHDSLIAECARWKYRTPDNWESAAQTIRTGLFPQRTSNLLAQLKSRGFYPTVDAPEFGQHGGSVENGHMLPITAGAGTIYYTLDGSDPRLPGGGVSATALSAVASTTPLVTAGSAWKYNDQGALPGLNWTSTSFNDAGWATGTAPLGYGTGDESTVVGYGPSSNNKYRTTYFRKSFEVANPAAFTGLSIGLVRDDGAVVYLNGVEVARSNMPTGTIDFSTTAAATVSGEKLTVFNIPVTASALVAGTNVIAVEIHQISAGSSDIRFDLSLTPTTLPTITLDKNTTVNARLRSGTTWSALTSADFKVTHPLAAAGPYVLTQWDAASPAGSSPPNLSFMQSDLEDPRLADAMTYPWTMPFNLTSRSRINGLGAAGIGFINTGSPQAVAGAGFVGAAVLSLDTRGTQDIRVLWTGGTIAPNERDQGIRLQYRIGDTGTFLDVPGPGGNPVEYLRNPVAGHAAEIGPVSLPSSAEDQALVQIRWKYYHRSGSSGARAQLRLDDIQVSAGPVVAESLEIVTAPPTAQAGSLSGPVGVVTRGSNGATAGSFIGPVTLAIDGQPGVLGGTTTRNAVNGSVVFDDLVFPNPGVYQLVASSSGLTNGVFQFPVRVAGLSEIVVPAFVQGDFPVNNGRVPHAALLRIDGLLPSATYRYANQMVTEEDSTQTDGTGTMIVTTARSGGFTRCTDSPRFLPADLDVRHGEFTTAPDGSHTGWFLIEPTANVRFTPGTGLHPRILLNDGAGGDITHHILTASGVSQVIAFGTTSGTGSALFGETESNAGNMIVLYADPDGITRPLAATPVENTGMPAVPNQAIFYQTEVSSRTGRWGTILPNQLPSGVRRFEIRDRTTGQILSVFSNPGGHDLTTGLAGGVTPTGIRIPAGNGFERWQSLRFLLSDIADGAPGSSSGDPDSDGVGNLLEYVLAGDPLAADPSILPKLSVDGEQLVFTFTRSADSSGDCLQTIQYGENPGTWTDLPLTSDQVTFGPVVSGLQTVTTTFPRSAVSGNRFFCRLKAVVTTH